MGLEAIDGTKSVTVMTQQTGLAAWMPWNWGRSATVGAGEIVISAENIKHASSDNPEIISQENVTLSQQVQQSSDSKSAALLAKSVVGDLSQSQSTKTTETTITFDQEELQKIIASILIKHLSHQNVPSLATSEVKIASQAPLVAANSSPKVNSTSVFSSVISSIHAKRYSLFVQLSWALLLLNAVQQKFKWDLAGNEVNAEIAQGKIQEEDYLLVAAVLLNVVALFGDSVYKAGATIATKSASLFIRKKADATPSVAVQADIKESSEVAKEKLD